MMKRRLLSFILCLAMLLTAAPVSARAEEAAPAGESVETAAEASAEETAAPEEEAALPAGTASEDGTEAPAEEETAAPADETPEIPAEPAEEAVPEEAAEEPAAEPETEPAAPAEEETLPEETAAPVETEEAAPALFTESEAALAAEEEELLPAAAPAASSALSLATKETGVAGFVERMYTIVLNRASEADGKAYWVKRLQNGTETGAEVAYGFYFSSEYKNYGKSNGAFVEDLYRGILGRESESGGKTYWVTALNDGMSRAGVFAGFVASKEFTNICKSYDVERGTYEITNYRDRSPEVLAFVQRLYRITLSRKGETEGVEYWCQNLITKSKTGSGAALGFFFSDEYTAKDRSDTAFIKDLYTCLLDREAESAGLNYWSTAMKSGMSRYGIFAGFAASNEFSNICRSYGINRGSYTPSNYRDRSPEKVNFVQFLYKAIIGKTAPSSVLENWCRKMIKEGDAGVDVAAGLFFSSAYTAKKKTDAQFIEDLGWVLTGKQVADSEIRELITAMGNGLTRKGVFATFANSEAFYAVCKSYGVTRGAYKTDDPADLAYSFSSLIRPALTAVSGGTPSASQLNKWAAKLSSGTTAASMMYQLFFSSEYLSRETSNGQFVTDIYKAVTGSAPTSSQKETMIAALNNVTMSRETALASLVNTASFAERCSALAVKRGSLRSAMKASDHFSSTKGNTFVLKILTVIGVAQNEVGYTEKSSRNDIYNDSVSGGSNFTKYWEELIAMGLSDECLQGEAWCNAFVNWCFVQAYGAEDTYKLLSYSRKELSYYTPTSSQYFKNAGRWVTENPQPGDVVYFANSYRIHHVGIVIKVDSTKIYTIEGNTSDAVLIRSYSKKDHSIAGYGRPDYSLVGEVLD